MLSITSQSFKRDDKSFIDKNPLRNRFWWEQYLPVWDCVFHLWRYDASAFLRQNSAQPLKHTRTTFKGNFRSQSQTWIPTDICFLCSQVAPWAIQRVKFNIDETVLPSRDCRCCIIFVSVFLLWLWITVTPTSYWVWVWICVAQWHLVSVRRSLNLCCSMTPGLCKEEFEFVLLNDTWSL